MNPRLASLAPLVLLSACFGLHQVDELRVAKAAPTAFEQELSRLYLEFVDDELERYDWASAGYFAKKGLLAAEGNFAAPENPDDWDIDDYAIGELRAARQSVLAKLTPAFRAQKPEAAAHLMLNYDCWVEEQEEGWEMAAIDACRQGVMRALEETDVPIPSGGPLSTSYLFHFPAQEDKLQGLASDELSLIANSLRAEAYPYHVIINGHAERGDEGSVSLSLRRADYIRDFLTKLGIAPARIDYNAFAEVTSQPNAADGAQRVELFIE